MKKQPQEIIPCFLDCLLMPTGEIICKGKVIGKFEDFSEFLIDKSDIEDKIKKY